MCFSPLLLLLLEREEEEREKEEEDAKEVLSAVNILRARSLCDVVRECVRVAFAFRVKNWMPNFLLFSFSLNYTHSTYYNENVPTR